MTPGSTEATPTEVGADVCAWRVVGASVVGTSHLAGGGEVEDAHAWRSDGGRLVLAVADGAGSAARSAEGAAAAVAAAVAAPDAPVPAARAAVEALRAELGVELGELASTLLVCVVDGDEVRLWAVGDGAAVVADGDGGLSVPLPPERGEYRNETVFVTSDAWAASLRTAVVPVADVHGVALLTDGLELLALDLASGAPHTPFFAPLLAFAGSAGVGACEELASFLGSDRVRSRTDDDCTLLVAVREP